MSVTIDHETLPAEELGLSTVGHVLSRLNKDNRLVVNLLIDGQEPDISQIARVRQSLLTGHTIFIETVEPKQMALDVLDEVELQLKGADSLRSEAVDLLQRNCAVKAMEKLSGCFSTWQHAQETVRKTAQLLRIDLDQLRVAGRTIQGMLREFTEQLKQIKSALEVRDFVTLCDVLTYEATNAGALWTTVLQAVREVARGR
jgi:hypothetical protein